MPRDLGGRGVVDENGNPITGDPVVSIIPGEAGEIAGGAPLRNPTVRGEMPVRDLLLPPSIETPYSVPARPATTRGEMPSRNFNDLPGVFSDYLFGPAREPNVNYQRSLVPQVVPQAIQTDSGGESWPTGKIVLVGAGGLGLAGAIWWLVSKGGF